MAEVMKFDDFKNEGSEAAVKVFDIILTNVKPSSYTVHSLSIARFSRIFILFFYRQAAGKYRQQGRNYVVEDGDIIFFKFNAGAGLKDAKKK